MAEGTHLDMTEIAAEALLKSYEKMADQLDFFNDQLMAIERKRDETMKRIESMCWQLLHGQAMADSPTTSISSSVPELEEETGNLEIIQEVADVYSSGESVTGSELDMLCSAEREMVEIDYSAERDCDLKISSDLDIFLIPTEFRLDGNKMEQNCSLTPLSIEEGVVESDANVRAKSDDAFKEERSSKLGDVDDSVGGVVLDTELHRFGLVNMNYSTDFNELQVYSMMIEEESKKNVAKTCSINEKDALFSGWTETINFSEFVSLYHGDYATQDCDYQTNFNDDSILISSDISQLDGKRKEVKVAGCSGDNNALFDPGGIVIDLCFSNNENLNCWRKNSITSINGSMVLPQLDGKFYCKTVYGLGLIQTYVLNYTSCISHNFMLELKQFEINDSINCALHKSSYLEKYKGRVTDIERLFVLGQIGFGGRKKMAFQLHASLLSVVCLLNIKLNMDADAIMVYHFGLSDEKWNDDDDKLNFQQYLEAIMTSFLSKDDCRLSCVEMEIIDRMILQIFFEGIIATVSTLQEGSRDVANLLKCLLYPFDSGGCPFHKFTTNASLTKTNILLSEMKWNSLEHLSTLHLLTNEAQLTLSSIKLIWEDDILDGRSGNIRTILNTKLFSYAAKIKSVPNFCPGGWELVHKIHMGLTSKVEMLSNKASILQVKATKVAFPFDPRGRTFDDQLISTIKLHDCCSIILWLDIKTKLLISFCWNDLFNSLRFIRYMQLFLLSSNLEDKVVLEPLGIDMDQGPHRNGPILEASFSNMRWHMSMK